MKKELIPYKETGQFSTLFCDYIEGNPQLNPFYEYSPKASSFKNAISDFEQSTHEGFPRTIISNVIQRRYEINSETASALTRRNIELLKNEKCFTVTTGHQLCLFGGPLYFIYKILTVIKLAEQLKKQYPENYFVPVYWMASEDHDFKEINHVNIYDSKVEWNLNTYQSPSGKISTSTMEPVLNNLFSLLGDETNGFNIRIKEIFKKAYTGYATLSDATFYFVNELFGEYGLVILDADLPELKREFINVMADELKTESSYLHISKTDDELQKQGYEPQVNPRNINLFFMDESGRNRIEKNTDTYSVVNTEKQFGREQLLTLLHEHPEQFSPNVVLRPLYQQTILPNIAYIGGPAEIAYWLQLKSTFRHHNISFPILLPRNSALLLDSSISEKIKKSGIEPKMLFRKTDDIIKDHIKQKYPELSFEKEKEKLTGLYHSIIMKTAGIDSTLTALPEGELQKQKNALEHLEAKIIKSQKLREETDVNRIRRIKEKLFPSNEMQERYENFIPYYLQYGKQFFDFLLENFEPFDKGVTILEL